MKMGITQGAVSVTGKEFLERTAKMGLAGVEPYIAEENSEFLSWSSGNTKQFVDKAKKLGVEIPSVALGVFNNDSALVTSEGQAKAVKLTIRTLQFASAVGAKTMLLCTYLASHPDTPQKKFNLLEVIHKVTPLACKLGVTIGLESPLPAAELEQLVDVARSDCVGVYYDLGNAVALGFDPAREIEVLGGRILAVHVKDSANVLGALHLGEGKLDLKAAIETLRRIGYDGWLILETPGGDEHVLQKDINILNQYLKRKKG